jgi:ribosome-associated heat shock protein Hsp15
MPLKMEEAIRIDKWLWAVRVFKTRSQASDACKNGKVKCGDTPVKASREIKVGEIFTVHFGPLTRTLKVKERLQNRVSAALVPNYMEDLTPAAEIEQLKAIRDMKQGIRPRGFGRPTKKERRDLEDFGAF